ncbi:EF-hand domain [Macleaya cordata]|uniref:EF-hand domain n=1 Tax=Macleaya cordata TaxID=56857 RepID=A0A200R7I3_MACCD|nr:EF-hand domain [Macleaya cordata]
MASVDVSKPASKWLSSKNKSLKLLSLPQRLKRSLSSSSSSSSSSPRNIPSSSPITHLLPKKSTKKEEEFKEVFRFLDGDGDGNISSLELRAYFGSIGEYMSHEEAQGVINDLDSDGDGLLDFNDFMVLMKRPSTPKSGGSSSSVGDDDDDDDDDDEDIKMAFEMYEAEKGCGCITPKSLQRMLNRLGDAKSYQ